MQNVIRRSSRAVSTWRLRCRLKASIKMCMVGGGGSGSFKWLSLRLNEFFNTVINRWADKVRDFFLTG